jgi:hypothetical protein
MIAIRLTLIFIILFFLSGCSIGNDEVIENKYSSSPPIDIELVEEIRIDISEYGSGMYDNKFVFKENNTLYFLGYDGKSHGFDLINLTDRVIEKRIVINKEGPDGIQTVFKTFVHNLDSIFIVDYQLLKIIDMEGHVRFSIPTVFPEDENIPEGNIINYNDADVFFDASINRFYGFYFPFANYEGGILKQNTPFVCWIDIKTRNVEVLPIKYPSLVRKNYDRIHEKMPNMKFINNKLFYGFPFLSNIYEFDFVSEISKSYGGKSKYSDNFSVIDNDGIYNYRLTGTIFYNLEFISCLSSYMRGHWGSQDIFQNDGSQSDNFTKDGYIIFFDRYFRYINEIKVDDSYWIEEYFVLDDHLYLYKKKPDRIEEDFLIFGKFKFTQKSTSSSSLE